MGDPLDDEVEQFITDHAHLKNDHIRVDLQTQLDHANANARESARALHVAPQNAEVAIRLKGSIRESLQKRKKILAHAETLGIRLVDAG